MLGIAREFHNDSICQGRISGTMDWQVKSYTVTGSGNHTFKWRYVKDSSAAGGSDCGWVDKVQWTGSAPPSPPVPMPGDWDQLSYSYDPAGRRISKTYDTTTVVKYVYDGGHCIAEYDGNNQLLRRYIYGPGVDQPICMIDVEHSSAAYYYHFDGLGSVIALTNSTGSVVNLYEYSVFGEVSASDPNHPNRFLFTGREFDKDTGLYYYRARYYNPYIGRFLQTDPVGDGYAYCANDPLNSVDPSGCDPETPWYEFTVKFAAGVLSYGQIGFVPGDYFSNVYQFFSQIGLFDRYPDWILSGAELKEGQDDVEQPLLTVTFRTAYYRSERPEPGKPRIGWRNQQSVYGGKGNKIPILTINEYSILTWWNLERMIRPQIERINRLPKPDPLGNRTLLDQYLELERWDTILVGDKNKWTYNIAPGHVEWWLGEEINYIAGGHLLAHYGFSWYMAETAAWYHNMRFFRFPWQDPVKRRVYWLLNGYDLYKYRKHWGMNEDSGTIVPGPE